MLKSLVLPLWRIAARAIRISGWMDAVKGFVLVALLFLGWWNPDPLNAWLAKPGHRAIALVGIALFLVFCAAYDAERELEGLKEVSLSFDRVTVELKEHLNVDSSHVLNVLIVRVEMTLRNEGGQQNTVFFPEFHLWRLQPLWRREGIPLVPIDAALRINVRGVSGLGDLLFPTKRFEVPPREILEVNAWRPASLPEVASAFFLADLKLELLVDAIGCPKFRRSIKLPRLTAFNKREVWESPAVIEARRQRTGK